MTNQNRYFKMNILAKAIMFASEKHVDQSDKGGRAYILHPLRMMMRLRTNDDELMSIAVLHDVVEDCKISFDDLKRLGMTDRVIEGVKSLTKQNGETYEQFIDRVSLNHDAMLVKREDLRDNSDITRLKGISEKDIDRMTKYMIAFRKLDSLLK